MKPYLYEKLKEYKTENVYPFHMPGHKRMLVNKIQNPYEIDITEIDGFDNLNDPQDIILQSMEEVAKFYNVKKTFYLVNGSTVGLLATITATCKRGDKILMARNCHKAVYHAVRLLQLKPIYLPMIYDEERQLCIGIDEDKLKEQLEREQGIKAVVVTSPTYEGIVMHIEKIKMCIKPQNIPLIVDEAHGAHFPFFHKFPMSAIEKGADIVIQSLHKTMPAFTQTAIIHVCHNEKLAQQVQEYLSIYQSSSPSYLFMAGIEYAIHYGITNTKQFEDYYEMLSCYREKLSHFRHFELLSEHSLEEYNICAIDPCKLVFFLKNTSWTGNKISDLLLEKYKIQMEMSDKNFVLGISTVMDIKEGFERLYDALLEIDQMLSEENTLKNEENVMKFREIFSDNEKCCEPFEALESEREWVELEKAEDKICGDYIYLYPPGIPLLVAGERIKKSHITALLSYKKADFYVKGMKEIEEENKVIYKIQVVE